ncbi:MAG: DNA mismatch repair protein MutT, partial [Chloroflexota bacterium]|nr:DNA mismatch repair protein MutT [Chloroflexota bacterium]
RELWEETGIEGAVIGPCLWTREARLRFGGDEVLVRERFFLARVPAATVSLANLVDEAERAVYRGNRWWTAAELRASRDRFSPPDLPALVGAILAGDRPAVPLEIR